MSKLKPVALMALLVFVLACQTLQPQPPTVTAIPTPPPDLTVNTDEEFVLVAGQSATINDSPLTLKLVGVTDDARCPSQIECAMSGPVSLMLIVTTDLGGRHEVNLQTFTNAQGRAPEMEFEGIQSHVEIEGYSIRVMAVLPYPATLADRGKGVYQITLIVKKV